MKKFLVTLMIGGACLVLSSGEKELSPEELFEATTAKIDKGGEIFEYCNFRKLGRVVAESHDFTTRLQPVIVLKRSEDLLPAMRWGAGRVIGRSLLAPFQSSGIQATAVSSRYRQEAYDGKAYLYTGTKPKGLLLELFERQSKSFRLRDRIPLEAIFFLGGHINPPATWKSTGPKLKVDPESLDIAGIVLMETFTGITGEFLFVMISPSQWFLIMPDQGGNLRKVVEECFGEHFIQMVSFLLEGNPDAEKPSIRVEWKEGMMILTNLPELPGGAFPAEFSDFAALLPEEGIVYAGGAFSPETMLTGQNFPKEGAWREFLGADGNFRFMGVIRPDETGFRWQSRSTFPISPALFLSGVSAFQGWMDYLATTREWQRIGCIENQLEIVSYFRSYARKNQGKLPELQRRGRSRFWNSVYHCKANPKTEVGYILVTGFDLKTCEARHIPVVFDRPGANHRGQVNITFIDSSRISLPVKDYQEPGQVILELHKKEPFSEDILERLLECVRNFQPPRDE